MFAYLASHNSRDRRNGAAAIQRIAEQYGVPTPALQQVAFPKFQLDFFDTGNELQCYKDERFVLLLCGNLLNAEVIRSEFGALYENDAELVFRLYRDRPQNLNKLDGHFSFLLFDSQEKKMSLMSDRFLRYSVVYAANDATFASSHSNLLHPFLNEKSFDTESFSQAIHFRWFTGDRQLFTGVHQVLPGSVTHIDKRGNTEREAIYKTVFRRETNLDQEYWIRQADKALDRSLSLIAKKHDSIGIPLSGGVDSSLLLAKASEGSNSNRVNLWFTWQPNTAR